MENLTGSPKIGKYEIIRHLGDGATANVYLGRDPFLQKDVAIKIMKPALVADPTSFERFAQEAQNSSTLYHPYIASVSDMGEDNGRYYIVLRYISGIALDKYLQDKGSLSLEDTLRMAEHVGSALDFAHQKKFLHRDVKPSNIIRSDDNEYVLTDFGLMRAMMTTGLTTHTGAILGTPAYIAPEVWNDEAVGPAIDQYALACVVAEVLTGKPVFTGNTPPAIMNSHLEKHPQQSLALPASVPTAILPVIQRGLAARPEDRYPSCTEFAEALKAAAEVQPKIADTRQEALEPPLENLTEMVPIPPTPIKAEAVSIPEPALPENQLPVPPKTPREIQPNIPSKKPVRPSALRWILMGVGGGVLLCIIAIWAIVKISSNIAASVPTETPAVAVVSTADSTALPPTFTPLAPMETTPPVPTEANATSTPTFPPEPTAILDPTFTPTAAHLPVLPPHMIAFASTRNQSGTAITYDLFLMDSKGQNIRTIAQGCRLPNWSRDGKQLTALCIDKTAATQPANLIAVMNVDGSGLKMVPGTERFSFPFWSTTGRLITMSAINAASDKDTEIWSMNNDGKNIQLVTKATHLRYSPVDGTKIAYSALDSEGVSYIFTATYNFQNWKALTPAEYTSTYPVWSPDGTKIAYVARPMSGGNFDIWVMNSDGSNPVNLTNQMGNNLCPSWSPDGSQITFATSRDGNSEIYVMLSNGSNPKNISNNAAIESCPDWQP